MTLKRLTQDDRLQAVLLLGPAVLIYLTFAIYPMIDVVVLSFVLHHVPDERKRALLREALRVCRGTVVIVEDTPVTLLDRLMNRRHGESYRRRIKSTASFGFLTEGEWRWLFRGMGLEPEARPLSRFCRSILQPFARTAFLLRVAAPAPVAV